MTVEGWFCCIVLALFALGAGIFLFIFTYERWRGVWLAAGIIIAVVVFIIGFWYYGNTASGIRELTDERANFQNGLERTITIYTANGAILKQYDGKIDIEQDKGYVKFDWNGKRYIYYNCYVETIADIGGN